MDSLRAFCGMGAKGAGCKVTPQKHWGGLGSCLSRLVAVKGPSDGRISEAASVLRGSSDDGSSPTSVATVREIGGECDSVEGDFTFGTDLHTIDAEKAASQLEQDIHRVTRYIGDIVYINTETHKADIQGHNVALAEITQGLDATVSKKLPAFLTQIAQGWAQAKIKERPGFEEVVLKQEKGGWVLRVTREETPGRVIVTGTYIAKLYSSMDAVESDDYKYGTITTTTIFPEHESISRVETKVEFAFR
ncbi:MAG: hypothetical protein JSR76_06220 [Verrucomicrobia bacterium]|nr:hypothetical protein [Verrucomicrobiota bacterium]